MKGKIIDWLKNNPKAKKLVLDFLIHPVKTRPRWYLRLFIPFYIHKGKRSVLYNSVRKDIAPFNKFFIGDYSVIEDFSLVNNLVGDIIIGNYSRLGLNNVVIGPVIIGSNVNLAQNITVSGLDHNYKDTSKRIDEQGVSTSLITIDDNVWIGANCVITKGVNIGKHSVIAAGSVVSKNIPPYSVAAGNPARVMKSYNSNTGNWEKVV
ncbi:MAG: acyltransferase [Bacteroidales bacterium]|jgi:acetyltransferase-like isoleucine patch superfamily enzyme|nr:acyltransferase [Bacteroidales bacterium]